MTVTLQIFADWDNDGAFEDNLNALSLTISRGLDPITGQIRVGTAQIVLKNDDGRYSPYYASSPLYPDVLPGRTARIQITYAPNIGPAQTRRQFTGPAREITVEPSNKKRTATLDCVDLMERLRRVKVNTALLTNKRSDELISTLLTLAGYSGGTNLDTGTRTFPYALFEDVDCLTAIQQVVDSELGNFFINGIGEPTFKARFSRWNDTAAVATLADDFQDFSFRLSTDTIYNSVDVTVHPIVVRTSGVIWTWGEVPRPITPTLSWNVEVVFHDPTTGAECWAQNVITPVAGTDFRANTSPDGTGTDKTSNITVSGFSYTSQRASFTISSNYAGLAWITLSQVRGAAIVKVDPVTARSENATSQTDYGLNPLSIDLPLETDIEQAQLIADYYANVYGIPLPVVDLNVAVGKVANGQDRDNVLANLDLNERLQITNAIAGFSARAFYVDAIQVSANNHEYTYQYSGL